MHRESFKFLHADDDNTDAAVITKPRVFYSKNRRANKQLKLSVLCNHCTQRGSKKLSWILFLTEIMLVLLEIFIDRISSWKDQPQKSFFSAMETQFELFSWAECSFSDDPDIFSVLSHLHTLSLFLLCENVKLWYKNSKVWRQLLCSQMLSIEMVDHPNCQRFPCKYFL